MTEAVTLTDVLRAEAAGADLQDGPYGIHVFAMNAEGLVCDLGHVSAALVYQDPVAARAAISRIKFGQFNAAR